MSSEFIEKKPSRLQAEIDANKLASYTVHILSNRKYFPDTLQTYIVPKIIDSVFTMAEKVNESNSIDVRKGDLLEKYKVRISLQKEALELLNITKQRIKILRVGFNLAWHKANAWSQEVKRATDSIQAWHISEIKKYKSLGGSL